MTERKILNSHIAYKGGHIQVREDRVIEPAGHECSREIVVHPGAVCIVARPTPEDVILIRQYRHATGHELLEIPAGTLHARRRSARMRDSGTGRGSRISRGQVWSSAAVSGRRRDLQRNSCIFTKATNLTKTQINPDEDEVIEVEIVPRSEALQMIDDGRIQDAKSILGLLRVLK